MIEYVCQPCGSPFLSEELFLEHFISSHVQPVKENPLSSTIDHLRFIIQKEFGDCPYTIENHLSSGGEYAVKIWHEGTMIEQYFGDSNIFNNPKTVDDFVICIHATISWKRRLLQKISSQCDLSEIQCSSVEYGNAPRETNFQFTFQVKGEENSRSCRFYPFDGMNEEDFISSFKQYTTTSIEGSASWCQNYGFISDYAIDGVPLDSFFKKGKRVRIRRVQ